MNALYLIGCRVKSNRQNSALKIYQKRDIPHVFKLEPCLGKTEKSKQGAKIFQTYQQKVPKFLRKIFTI